MPVGNALFEPILQCVSRYTATHLVFYNTTPSFLGLPADLTPSIS